ncbi:MAG: 4Fe-4S ferredoxin [Coriobacteriales bacterium]|jgi:formate hydrogenlyase subunit 6/NADH:ubiquinone oxidoreductase subunit I|nr:4Fe-4S ferredoxin [Coriobacteriales bacterium]
MPSFMLGKMSLRNLFKKPATKLYPIEKPQYFQMTKGHIENNIDSCIFCSICEKKCPAAAISVNKSTTTWSINPYCCVQCYICVRNCPKNCLSMKSEYAPAARQKTQQSFVLSDEQKELREAEAKKRAEVAAAAKAKKAAEAL